MQYAILIYDREEDWASMPEAQRGAMFAEYGRFTQDLKAAGKLRAGEPLQPSHSATTVRVRDGKTLTTDGPYAETREQLGGFYVLEADNLDEAVAWAARIPSALIGSVEVRPLATLSLESS